MIIKKKGQLLPFVLLIGSFFACAKPYEGGHSHAHVPDVVGSKVDLRSIPEGTTLPVQLSNHSETLVENRAGTLFYQVEGTFSPEAFSKLNSVLAHLSEQEKTEAIQSEIQKIFKKFEKIQATGFQQVPEVGYFTFDLPYQPDLMDPLKNVDLPHEVIINPVLFDPENNRFVQELTEASDDLQNKTDLDFNGTDRIHISEFIKNAKNDIGGGISIDGSSVRVGVADSGITLNHANFRSQKDGSDRIIYMRDFTKEGRVYFNPTARFEVKTFSDEDPETLILNAEYIKTPKLPLFPVGDSFEELKEYKIKVSPELKQILTRPNSQAAFGILDESVYQSPERKVNLSGLGTGDRKFSILFVPGENLESSSPPENVLGLGEPNLYSPKPFSGGLRTKGYLYMDVLGNGDFRNSKPIGDWNQTRSTISLFAEKIGFEIGKDEIASKKKNEKLKVYYASVVGFDPGRHGTHVSGIIAGSQIMKEVKGHLALSGIAPEARLLVNRVCAINSGCRSTQAFVDLAVNGRAQIINLSLGSLSPFNDGFGVQEIQINRLTVLRNVLFFVSAGNSGPGRQTVGSPSTARFAISVGATGTRQMIQSQYQWPASGRSNREAELQDEDFMLFFSARGPSAAGGFKPDLCAPGSALSSVSLNGPPGMRAGADVLWGTSMAAPAAAGAFALFLDAIQKYNDRHPMTPLPTDVTLLREVLLQSARPFDLNRFDPETQKWQEGQYTWIDEGMGMMDLSAAWRKLFELRDQVLPSAVQLERKSVELDYEVNIAMKAANGNAYTGVKSKNPDLPKFGHGLYLNYQGTDYFYEANISRKLPEKMMLLPQSAELQTQLDSSRDEFVLKTSIYGSDKVWIKAGTLNQLDCLRSKTSNLMIYGDGSTVQIDERGDGRLRPFYSSTLNLCLDRKVIAHELPPGDHGALISAYRMVNGKVALLPSFTVPVYLTVPHKIMAAKDKYEIQDTVTSFGVKRNYISIQPGTPSIRVTIEVPAIQTGSDGLPLWGQTCSGVELMVLKGGNTLKGFASRKGGQVLNCSENGSIEETQVKRSVIFSAPNPKPGVWDLSVLGSYRFPKSQYRLVVETGF